MTWSHLEWESLRDRETCMRRHLRVALVFVTRPGIAPSKGRGKVLVQ